MAVLKKLFYRLARPFERNRLMVPISMSNRWKRKCAQLNNLESAREAKKRDVLMDAEQEVTVLSTDTTEQYRTAGFSFLQHKECW